MLNMLQRCNILTVNCLRDTEEGILISHRADFVQFKGSI